LKRDFLKLDQILVVHADGTAWASSPPELAAPPAGTSRALTEALHGESASEFAPAAGGAGGLMLRAACPIRRSQAGEPGEGRVVGALVIGRLVDARGLGGFRTASGFEAGLYHLGRKIASTYQGLETIEVGLTWGETGRTAVLNGRPHEVRLRGFPCGTDSATILVATPSEHARTLVRRGRVSVLAVSLTTGLLSLLLTYLVTRDATRPILHLARAASEIGRGNWEVPLPALDRRDELGVLARSFAIMVEQKRKAEQELVRRNRQLQGLGALALRTGRTLEVRDIARVALSGIPVIFDVHRISLRLYEATRDELRRVSLPADPNFRLARGPRQPLAGSVRERVVREGAPLVVSDLRQGARRTRPPLGFACVPLSARGEVLGTLDLVRWGGRFSDEEVRLFVALGHQLGAAIRNALDLLEIRFRNLQVMRSEVKYRSLMENAGDLILIADPEDFRILEMNGQAERLTGRPRADLTGLTVAELFPEEERTRVSLVLAEAASRGSAATEELSLLRDRDAPLAVGITLRSVDVGDRRLLLGILRDISARNRLEAELVLRNSGLQEERSRLQAALQSVPDGLVVTDLDFRIQRMNRPAEEMLEPSGLPARGVPLPSGPEWAPLLKLLVAAARGEDGGAAEIAWRGPDGRERFTVARVSRIRREGGEAIGYLVTLRDTTQERELDRLKSDFLSTISHELRTPLTSILGFSSLLLDDGGTALDPEQRDFASTIHQQGRHLLGLINDLLDLSKLESGVGTPQREEVAVAEAFHAILTELRLLAAEKGIDLQVEVAEPALAAWADPRKLHQCLINLVGNAIKFTPSGGRVTLAARRVEGAVELDVADTGPGIPANKRARLFTKFYQVESGDTRSAGGTGLGLAITRKIMDLHGGDVRLESEEGRGSVFTLSFPSRPAPAGGAAAPAAVPAPPAGAPAPTAPAPHSRSRGRVLAVDDHPGLLRLVRGALRGVCEVEIATSGPQALKKARERVPDLVLMDLAMPEMDGLETIRRMRQEPALREVPVQVLTAKALGLRMEEVQEAGAQGVITKPFEPAALAARVAELLAGRAPTGARGPSAS
jgi:PAS domain S-box-containing protein